MSLPDIVSREEWLTARKAFLVQEKEVTRRRDALNADRRRLPMVRVDTDYVFTGPDGEVRLDDLFGGHSQLVVQHVMFKPEWEDACPGCTGALDELSAPFLAHLAHRNTAFAAVSRAPYPKLAAYRDKRGWDFLPWYSSSASTFNYDYHVTLDPAVAPVVFNYRDADELRAAGMADMADEPSEISGMSCFLRTPDGIFHTYSTYARGTDHLGGAYGFLDLTALGRQEEWEEPKGRSAAVFGNSPFFTAENTATEENTAKACDCGC
ncbi:MAG: DUF899 domain-containing protein [Hamadaea sp.]|uniref:DUF899 domain-containing protein n=1 Tax=Hamadaea sp. TaxID=2024425 RepID=UPI0017C6CCDD|nr:DUF899 domain-containing protein [Hamadaea sp.]NUR72807.1 DUF899 domain-containing protein [Hamadaea sp.]NUT20478.1 DUF899 domain-containing protein [Hamadaea sp.]